MKKYLLRYFLCLCFLLSAQIAAGYAYFQAEHISGNYSWNTLKYEKFETRVTMQGLFYQTTLEMKVALGRERRYSGSSSGYTCQLPNSGDYTWNWIFQLPDETIVTGLEIYDQKTASFVPAEMLDLSTAESYVETGNAPRALLREYRARNYDGRMDHFYRLQIQPVAHNQFVQIRMHFLSPCQMAWDVRRFQVQTRQFFQNYNDYCNNMSPFVFKTIDLDAPDARPIHVNMDADNWMKQDGYWTIKSDDSDNRFCDGSLIAFPAEGISGLFVQTFQKDNLSFYQISATPHISETNMPERHIVVGLDLTGAHIDRRGFLRDLIKLLPYCLSKKDSLAFIISDLNTLWLNRDFKQNSGSLIQNSINQTINTVPQLNTLPFLLREAVSRLNEADVAGEIWIISDDDQHGGPAGEVMDIVRQTVFKAKNAITFRILDVSNSYQYHKINNTIYYGNGYLYENLFRLSKGSYERLKDYYEWDRSEAVFDCFAPMVTSVEIDFVPGNGLSFSPVDLNCGRQHFHNMSRYFQIGMYEGNAPFQLQWFGNYQSDIYHRTFNLVETTADIQFTEFQMVKQYWFGDYVNNELLLQPQSYETIQYIESIAVDHQVLTPYSGLIVPGPDGSISFKKLTAADSVFAEATSVEVQHNPDIPEAFEMTAYPNPFNPVTTVTLQLPHESLNEPVEIRILNVLGQVVMSETLDPCIPCGNLEFQWDGCNQNGEQLGSGNYLIHVQSGAISRSAKLILMR